MIVAKAPGCRLAGMRAAGRWPVVVVVVEVVEASRSRGLPVGWRFTARQRLITVVDSGKSSYMDCEYIPPLAMEK